MRIWVLLPLISLLDDLASESDEVVLDVQLLGCRIGSLALRATSVLGSARWLRINGIEETHEVIETTLQYL